MLEVTMQFLNLPESYSAIIDKLISTVVIILLTLIANNLLRNVLRTRFKDSSQIHTLRMLLRNAVYGIGSILLLTVWLGVGANFTMAMGILGAGIAFASQELIGSFTGFLNIVTSNLYRIGDRVRIGDVIGDVLDINLLRTTVMEIGEWVQADQYTGRIVSIANRFVFSDPVFNYTKYWHFLWDEITLPITYGSDWRLATELMLQHGEEYSKDVQDAAKSGLEKLRSQYSVLEDLPVGPTLYIVMTDNWVEMTLRYVVETRNRRQVKAELHRELLEHFGQTPSITVASATFEIVGFPPLRSTPD
jgi:small-conductance mechanosensitive channel